ncbi:MAG: DUF3465 domain-containing protein [Gammaproteobacteria bacterium]|nr:DUF3465 domain-containing protein [Gammaproteobacteria bacterium]
MNQQLRRLLGVVAVIVLGLLGYSNVQDNGLDNHEATGSSRVSNNAPVAATAASDDDAAQRILAAFEAQRSDMWIEAGGRVQRTLADDNEGSRHQRFIVSLPNDHTILIAHNIDLAQRVPLKAGDQVSFFGEYEWNDRGGVIHWTHHDPRNKKAGGWIRHKGTTYR